MYIDFSCGKCDVSLSMESNDEASLWSMVHRFSRAHEACGFVSPVSVTDIPVEEVKRKLVQPRIHAEDE